MAVRHGYGKIAGADALVFAYDTGDTRNSYKGEPTTNLATLDLSSTKWYSEGGTKVLQSETLDGYPVYQFRSSGSLIYVSPVAFNQLTATSNDVTLSAYFKNVGTTAQTVNVFLANDFGTDSNGDPNNRSIPADGKWYRESWTRYAAANTYNQVEFRTFSDTLLISKPQVEYKKHATPPVEGTRSTTQGLLDMTGNRSINLTNLNGYDSNAQLVYDGTDDYIQINPFTLDVSNGLSYEIVYSAESTYNTWGTYHYLLRFVGTTHYGLLHEGDSRGWRFDVPTDGGVRTGSTTNNPNATAGAGYYHVAVSFDPVTGGKGYLNGEEIGSWAGGYTPFTPSQLLIGAETTGTRFWDGEIPVVKVYSRALTAAEVQSNYRHYKQRFNL